MISTYFEIFVSVGMDYTHEASSSVLSSHQMDQRLCFNITITADAILENDEVFQVFLTSAGLNFSPDTATIDIIDSNCKNPIHCQIYGSYIFST